MQQCERTTALTDHAKKRNHCRFNDSLMAVIRVFASAISGSAYNEMEFFRIFRTEQAKNEFDNLNFSVERNLAVRQVVCRAFFSSENF